MDAKSSSGMNALWRMHEYIVLVVCFFASGQQIRSANTLERKVLRNRLWDSRGLRSGDIAKMFAWHQLALRGGHGQKIGQRVGQRAAASSGCSVIF